MSLISDALRKASSSPAYPSRPPPPPRRFSFLSGLLLAGLIVLVILSVSPFLSSQEKSSSLKSSRPTLAEGSPSRPSFATAQAPSAPSSDRGTPLGEGLRLLRTAGSSWKLNGIIQGGDGESLALINGQVVKEGQTIRGARLLRVAQDQVELEENGKITTLRLE